jgi:hypothetical protein
MNTVEKMTKKETLEMIIDLLNTAYDLGEEKVEMAVEYCEKEIAALDRKAEKAKETAAKKKAENDALLEVVYDALGEDEFETIAAIAKRVVDVEPEATVGKVQYRLTALAKEGRAEKSTIVIPATEDTKMRKVVGYRKIVG